MDHEPRPWRVEARKEVYADLPWIRVIKEAVVLPNRARIPNFYRLELPEHVIVVPYREDGKVVAVRQYKHGAECVSLGLPGGLLAPNETPLRAGRRELLEETGFGGGRWSWLGTFVMDGNRRAGQAHILRAHGVRRLQSATEDSLEEMSIRTLSPAAFRRLLRSGDVQIASHALAFALAELDRNRLVRPETSEGKR